MSAADPKTKAQGSRLKRARAAAGFKSARAAALENNWKESSYRAHENGTRTIGLDDAETYAKRFKQLGSDISAKEILFGNNGNGAPSDTPLTASQFEMLGRLCVMWMQSRADVAGAFQTIEALVKVVEQRGGGEGSFDPASLRKALEAELDLQPAQRQITRRHSS